MQLLFILSCKDGKYKPMSTVLEIPNIQDYINNKNYYKQRAIDKICAKWNTTRYWLKNYGFTRMSVNRYND